MASTGAVLGVAGAALGAAIRGNVSGTCWVTGIERLSGRHVASVAVHGVVQKARLSWTSSISGGAWCCTDSEAEQDEEHRRQRMVLHGQRG